TSLKVVLTIGAFYLLLTHEIRDENDQPIRILDTIIDHIANIEMAVFLPFVLLATGIKFIGMLCSMWRWRLLLLGQGIRFNFGHIFGAFLTGRFLGTFLPSTVGLDGYKLYDASRHSGLVVEPAAATVVEKAMGFAG